MPPRITKKSKTKKQKSAIPHDLEFMLGEEISSPLDSPVSPTEAEYSLITAPPRDVLANLRLVGLAGNDTSSATGSTSSSSSDQRDQLVTSINNYSSNSTCETQIQTKTTQKKAERPIDHFDDVSGSLSDESTINAGDRPSYVENNPGNRGRSSDNETRSNRDDTNGYPSPQNNNYLAPDMTYSSTQSVVPSNTSGNASKSSKTKKSTGSVRRKSSPPKKNTSAGPKTQTRQTIGNDRDVKLLQNIARLQASTECLIPKLPFARLIRETMQMYCGRDLRITPECLQCLQEAAEIYAVQVMEDAYRCTLHRDRITLTAKDMKLALLLRNDSVMMNM
nr:histone H3-like centromeric protein cid [Aedes albopictus]